MKMLGRLLTAMVTPFDERGEVDYEQAKRLARALVDSGSNGVVVGATTGEAPTLKWPEVQRLCQEVKAVLGNRWDVIGYTGSNCTDESIENTREAEKAGSINGCLWVVPYYNNVNQVDILAHFTAIAQSTSLRGILYNVPNRTIVNMTAETTTKLSQIRNIVGVKEASGNMAQITQIIKDTPPDFQVWSGNDSDIYPILSLGGYGVISVASHLVGLQISSMISAYVDGETEKARELHFKLLPVFKALFLASNPKPVKYALNRVGFRVGKTRLPLTELNEEVGAQIMEVVKQCQIDLPMRQRR